MPLPFDSDSPFSWPNVASFLGLLIVVLLRRWTRRSESAVVSSSLSRSELHTKFLNACYAGNLPIVRHLLADPRLDKNYANAHGNNGLILACLKGHASIVRLLLEAPAADPNHRNKEGGTPLLMAAACGQGAALRELLLAVPGPDLGLANPKGSTALHLTCFQTSDPTLCMQLVAAGCPVNLPDKDGNTAFLAACIAGHTSVVQAILDCAAAQEKEIDRPAAQTFDLSLYNDDDYGPLHIAAMTGDCSLAHILLASGRFDINDISPAGLTPLAAAVYAEELPMVRWLLSHEELDPNLESDTQFGPLCIACMKGNLSVVTCLLADPRVVLIETKDSIERCLPLEAACAKGHVDIVACLLQDPRLKSRRSVHGLALMEAGRTGQEEVADLLLRKADIDPNQGNEAGVTALFIACAGRQGHVANRLLADPRLRPDQHTNEDGDTPLHMACMHPDDSGLVQRLLEAGFSPHAQNYRGLTPFLLACKTGAEVVVRALLDYAASQQQADAESNRLIAKVRENTFPRSPGGGKQPFCNLSIEDMMLAMCDYRGLGPLQHACLSGSVEVVDLLLETQRCDINYLPLEGGTALDCAIQQRHSSLVERLLREPDLDPNLGTGAGCPALHRAAQLRALPIVERLLRDPRVDPTRLSTAEGHSVLDMACMAGHVETVARLLHDVRVAPLLDRPNRAGWYPFLMACGEGHLEVVTLLLRGGRCDPSMRSQNPLQQNALHVACLMGQAAVTRRLVEDPHLDVNAIAADGNSALLYGVKEAHVGAVKALLTRADVRINQPDRYGATAMDLLHEAMSKAITLLEWQKSAQIWDMLAEKGGRGRLYAMDAAGRTPKKPPFFSVGKGGGRRGQ